MKKINFQQEWDLIIKEFNSFRFRKYSMEQKENWFNSQLLLIAIGNVKNKKEKLVLEDLYFRLKEAAGYLEIN